MANLASVWGTPESAFTLVTAWEAFKHFVNPWLKLLVKLVGSLVPKKLRPCCWYTFYF